MVAPEPEDFPGLGRNGCLRSKLWFRNGSRHQLVSPNTSDFPTPLESQVRPAMADTPSIEFGGGGGGGGGGLKSRDTFAYAYGGGRKEV